MRVFLAGEGRHELGGWANHPSFRDSERGIIEALLDLIAPGRWSVVGARRWKDIVKLRPGGFRRAEARNVEGVLLDAEEAGCNVAAFTRDRDGDVDRQKVIENCVEEQRDQRAICIVAGIPVEQIEAWVLSCAAVASAESYRDSKAELGRRFPSCDLRAMVEIIERTDLTRIPADAKSLNDWFEQVRMAARRADG